MKEIVVISGKGGTGKTTLVAAFAHLACQSVLADCDVDAANLHLVLRPQVREEHAFTAGQTAVNDQSQCTACGKCRAVCRFEAITPDYRVDALSCEGCGLCAHVCPAGSISMCEGEAGRWFISDTPYGPLVHARLGVAQENSGKLVALVRYHARLLAEQDGHNLVIIDGPPGMGCPVISSLTNTDLALLVTEPTLAGMHDLKRVLELARHFDVPALVCINKADLNVSRSRRICAWCREQGTPVVGELPFDSAASKAIRTGVPVTTMQNCQLSQAISRLWEQMLPHIDI